MGTPSVVRTKIRVNLYRKNNEIKYIFLRNPIHTKNIYFYLKNKIITNFKRYSRAFNNHTRHGINYSNTSQAFYFHSLNNIYNNKSHKINIEKNSGDKINNYIKKIHKNTNKTKNYIENNLCSFLKKVEKLHKRKHINLKKDNFKKLFYFPFHYYIHNNNIDKNKIYKNSSNSVNKFDNIIKNTSQNIKNALLNKLIKNEFFTERRADSNYFSFLKSSESDNNTHLYSSQLNTDHSIRKYDKNLDIHDIASMVESQLNQSLRSPPNGSLMSWVQSVPSYPGLHI
ncbi:hypothetical protein [Acetobacter sp.]|uniref:hypothetical protein n=1 Tax=Acetobacter sp. TaxID=440 RepID=UPI0025C6C05E|nr:hypothetical protein [Acetobacter sp.]MCH4091561.1 hypothetical protein [Acetobacter sp.]